MYDEPLALPKGSVRALISLSVVIGAVYGLVTGTPIPEWYIGVLGAVTGYYFATRSNES